MNNKTYFFQFFQYASFNVLGMLGLSCYILADTFFISKGLGANGLAALNLAIPVYSFIHGSGLMLGIGGGTKYAILNGKEIRDLADETFTAAAKLTAALSIFFVLLGIFCSGAAARFLGADDAVFHMTKTYLQVILLFAPMFMLNNLLLCFVRNDGAPHLAMAAMLGGSLSNIVLDYVFIFPLNMGIFGAVLATGLAPVVSLMILSPFFIRKQNRFHFIKSRLSSTCALASGILSSGLPSLVTEVSSGIVIIVFNIIILKLQGNIGIAAYGVVANLSLVVIAIYTGIAQGVQPILANCHGVGDRAGVHVVLRYALIAAAAVSAVVYAGVFFGAEQIAKIFNSGHNALLQAIAVRGLKLYFTGCLFAGVNIILSVYFTSTEVPRPAHVTSLLRGFVIILPMAFLLSAAFGIDGVWCAFPAAELMVSVIGFAWYFNKKRRSKLLRRRV